MVHKWLITFYGSFFSLKKKANRVSQITGDNQFFSFLILTSPSSADNSYNMHFFCRHFYYQNDVPVDYVETCLDTNFLDMNNSRITT